MRNKTFKKAKIIFFSLFVGFALIVSGCSVSEPIAQKPTIEQQRESYLHELSAMGVSIQQVGQKISLTMPSDVLFNVNSANFTVNAPKFMSRFVRYMNTYRLVAVKVAVYGDNKIPAKQQKLLTTAQAEKISQAFVEENLDFRLVYTVGYGDKKSITENKTLQQRAENRRVIISFQFYLEQSAD